MQSPPADTPPNGSSGKSRLDRELEEILAKNENIRLLPPPPEQPKPNRTRTPSPKVGSAPGSMIPPQARTLMASPIVVALGLAIAAVLVAGFSALLANLLGLAAVVCILYPMAQRLKRKPTAPPDIRMWRGQVIDAKPPQQPSPLDAAREWWKSRQR